MVGRFFPCHPEGDLIAIIGLSVINLIGFSAHEADYSGMISYLDFAALGINYHPTWELIT